MTGPEPQTEPQPQPAGSGPALTARTEAFRLTSLHPLHAVLLAGALPLFLGVLLSDWAYSGSHEIQWKNFASWLLVGGLTFAGLALAWALIDLARGRRDRHHILYVLVLLAAWILGFVNALIHAKDAWASMPDALVLAVITALLMTVAIWLGFTSSSPRDVS